MNILVIANFPPYVMGGAENQVARLVDAWLDLGHHVEIAGYKIPNCEVIRGKHHVRLHHIHVCRQLGRYGTAFTYFLSLIFFLIRKKGNFDIVYCRGLGDATITICLAKKMNLFDFPLVACPINAKGQGDIRFIRSIPGWRYIVQIINRYCNGINIIAADIKEDLKEIGIGVSRMREIPNGIPVRPIIRKYQSLSERKLLFTGRLSHQKGLDLLINTLAQLRDEGYKFHCDIVGDGPLFNELKSQIEHLSLTDIIKLTGQVPGEKIRDMLLFTDVFIMPSRYEGMSNSVLEAMETGTPVLATRCGGIDHYIKDLGGWTCPPSNQEALTNCIREMLESPTAKLKDIGLKNRTSVINNFSIQQIAKANIDFFEEIVSAHNDL